MSLSTRWICCLRARVVRLVMLSQTRRKTPRFLHSGMSLRAPANGCVLREVEREANGGEMFTTVLAESPLLARS